MPICCPFAYVLCSLSECFNQNAITQLVGRILRQPYALKTGVAALDECYVVTHHASRITHHASRITHHAATGDVVAAIKTGLKRDGLADLVIEVPQEGGGTNPGTARGVERRDTFKSLQIYLPKVLKVEAGEVRDLDYETDILAAIDWRDFSPAGLVADIPENPAQVAAHWTEACFPLCSETS